MLVLCLAVLVAAGTVAARLRPRLGKSAEAAALFAVPAAVLVAPVGFLAATGETVAAAPLALVMALCGLAAWLFAPTRRGRFASFEHQFRAYAARR